MSEFERWQNRFAAEDYVFGEAPNAFLASCRDILPNAGTALSIADGEGRNGVWLAQQGLDVLSLDFSPHAQRKAQKLAAERGVTLRTEIADMHAWAWPHAHFDVIVEIFAQVSTPDERAAKFAGMKQALKPGGLLLVEGYTPRQLTYGTGGPKQRERLYTRPLLEEAFGGLARIEIKEYDTHMSEGTGHAGMAAVIDCVAWK